MDRVITEQEVGLIRIAKEIATEDGDLDKIVKICERLIKIIEDND